MKITKLLKEIKEKENKTLSKDIVELNQQLTKLNLDAAMHKLKNVKSIQATRKQIARTMTILNERAILKANEVTK